MKGFLVLILSSVTLVTDNWAQLIIPQAQVKTELNEWGDPVNNIIDADGSQQGQWLYQDINGNRVFRQDYVDNTLVGSYFNVSTSESLMKWENVSTWETNLSLELEIKNHITSALGSLSEDQQILLFIDDQGALTNTFFLGNWSQNQTSAYMHQLSEYINTHQPINVNHATYVLL